MVNNSFKNDEDALLKLATGDLVAYRYLFDRYFPDLCNFLRIYLHSKEFSEEIALGIFEFIWEKRETLLIRHSFKAFLFSAAKNRAISHYRKEHKAIFTSLELHESNIPDDPSSLDYLEEVELRGVIDAAIRKLPDKSREIYLMAWEEKLSHKEIAYRLGLTPKTVENHVGIALRKLRESLTPYYKQIFMSWLILMLIK
jgi:RNA polymerase sigma-70 factor (ECF subfamily)